ncbi:MAG: phenylacetate--CoA ligase family protein [Bradyrhizobiaceae bacterium]|nr:phenylacetate--CoA ligase family protein [Bradyrhizobiaceae bacterium]
MREQFSRYLRHLEETESRPQESIAREQGSRLESMLRHGHANAPFYRDRLQRLFDANGTLDAERWHEIPVTEREDVAAHGAAMRVAALSAEYGPVAEFTTSGTTGIPLTIAVNGMVSMTSNANLARLMRWFGFDRSRPLASIGTYPGDASARYPSGKIGKGWIAGERAPQHALDVSASIAEQLEWLARVRAPYLLTYPSNAMALAEALSPEQGRALGIELVIGHAETVPDGARELIAERLGARFASYYSSREIGTIAIECPAGLHYHVTTDNAVVEIVDEHGRAAPVGGRGRVLVTSLNNYAMPFIRYAIGDVAVAGAQPSCGCPLPMIARIEGRTRNAFTFGDGTRIWPRGWLAHEMRAFVPFRQYQMVQLDHERIEFRYVPDGSGRNADLEGLAAYVREKMHPSVQIILTPMDVLPRGPSGKFEDFISLVSVRAADRPPSTA